jgi:hypothetical protein
MLSRRGSLAAFTAKHDHLTYLYCSLYDYNSQLYDYFYTDVVPCTNRSYPVVPSVLWAPVAGGYQGRFRRLPKTFCRAHVIGTPAGSAACLGVVC